MRALLLLAALSVLTGCAADPARYVRLTSGQVDGGSPLGTVRGAGSHVGVEESETPPASCYVLMSYGGTVWSSEPVCQRDAGYWREAGQAAP